MSDMRVDTRGKQDQKVAHKPDSTSYFQHVYHDTTKSQL